MSTVNVAKLTNSQLTHLTQSQLNFIVTLLTAVQIQLLIQSQVQMLSSAQIAELSSLQIGELTLSEIQELLNSQLGDLSNTQLQYIINAVVSNQFLQDNLSITQKQSLNEIYQLATGQIVSFGLNDDGNLKQGRLVDFFTLKTNNVFGNTHRFTDENGNQVFPSHYLIDHATGLGWHTLLHTAAPWTTALAEILTLPVGINTFNDFFLPNVNEVLSITIWSQVCLNYAPFNLNPGVAGQIWTSTTNYSNTISAIRVSYQTIPGASSGLKGGSQPYLMCRKHF